ncbi:hypothetical protein MCP_0415 [Methanocella paludicola SANAE]|uniref:Uncharacterized protein n=2 Tax=Methanocella TaxID=570266 RepID=D1YVL5_METPS|nr:hypothetical protein MCP_0415 [Methanocella paludicola SANAE]
MAAEVSLLYGRRFLGCTMKLKMSDRMLRLVRLLWLPVLLVILIVADSYLKISESSYSWAFIGLQIALFLVYTYFLFKDRQKYVAPANRVMKGKRKTKK